jgi:Holliday junction resolvasome RuvABC endonuclease subunit
MATQHPVLQDFRKFTYVVWKHLNLPEPTPVQYDIAQYLQHGPRRSVIEAFRGVGKSWLTSAFVCWLLLNNPQLKILVVSASKERADAFSTFVKRLINEIPALQHLQPKDGQRDSVISFDVGPAQPDHSPSVKSVGITGQITGSRADILIADDVEVPNNSATQMMRDKLSESVKEFDAILKPGGRIIYLGTPQTEMSLYNQLPERGYEVRIWPALYPELNKVESYKGRLAPKITKELELDPEQAGMPTDPRRFHEADLLERRASYGRAGFALQFMLDTSLSDGDRYPLKVADLIIQNLNPTMAHLKVAWATSPELTLNDLPNVALTGDRYYRPMWHSDDMSEYTGAVMSIDPSGRGKDETGYAVVKNLAGNLFLTEAGGITGGYELETLEALAHAAKRNQVKYIIIEANFGDGMFTQLIKPVLQRIYPCTVEEVKHSTQKEARIIDTLEPVMSTHRLIVDAKVIQKDFETAKDLKKSLFYQMTRLTRDRGALTHDDRLDALAIAVAYWTESMARDNNKAAKEIKNQHLDKELKRFMSGILGSKPRPTTWM